MKEYKLYDTKLKFKLDVSQAFVLQSRLLYIDMRQGVQRPFFRTIVSYIVSPYEKLHLENRIRKYKEVNRSIS